MDKVSPSLTVVYFDAFNDFELICVHSQNKIPSFPSRQSSVSYPMVPAVNWEPSLDIGSYFRYYHVFVGIDMMELILQNKTLFFIDLLLFVLVSIIYEELYKTRPHHLQFILKVMLSFISFAHVVICFYISFNPPTFRRLSWCKVYCNWFKPIFLVALCRFACILQDCKKYCRVDFFTFHREYGIALLCRFCRKGGIKEGEKCCYGLDYLRCITTLQGDEFSIKSVKNHCNHGYQWGVFLNIETIHFKDSTCLILSFLKKKIRALNLSYCIC